MALSDLCHSILVQPAYWLPGIAAPEAINHTKNAIAAIKITVGAIALLFTAAYL